MSTYAAIQKLLKQYPDSKSAVLPALRLVQQEHDGWLPPEALREVADALDLTPAYCASIASFYDQFHLEPAGRTRVEVCTNVSCALAGAQQVVEAFEQELGMRAGTTSKDGSFTLGTVEYDIWPDGWTVVTKDRRRSAQFEHTVLVTDSGSEILTLPSS